MTSDCNIENIYSKLFAKLNALSLKNILIVKIFCNNRSPTVGPILKCIFYQIKSPISKYSVYFLLRHRRTSIDVMSELQITLIQYWSLYFNLGRRVFDPFWILEFPFSKYESSIHTKTENNFNLWIHRDSCLLEWPIKSVCAVELTKAWPHYCVFMVLTWDCIVCFLWESCAPCRCPVLLEINCYCGFLGGLISEKNNLLGPSVSYVAEP